MLVVVAACSPSPSSSGFAALPPGNAESGAALFAESVNGAPACTSCHTLDGSTLVGPSLQGYASVAGTLVAGQSAQEYTFNSIVTPAAFVVNGFSNLMYAQYGQKLNPQQTADIIAYLLTLS
jgi:cytochrome c oxidase subunit 2